MLLLYFAQVTISWIWSYACFESTVPTDELTIVELTLTANPATYDVLEVANLM